MASITALAQKIKTAHAEYNDIPDLELVEKVIAKYPQYVDMLDEGDRIALGNLASSSKDSSVASEAGNLVKAGGAGIADIASGNGFQQAAADVNKVTNEEEPETGAGKIGSTVGGLFTPNQIMTQATIGPVLEASGLGEKVINTMRGWAGDAALAASGKIKTLAKSMGLTNLPALGEFLLSPVKIGTEEFPAIVQSTSSITEMLENAQAIKAAAGKQLGVAADAVDTALNNADTSLAINDQKVILDLNSLQQKLTALKAAVEESAPRLGKAVITQYENAIGDVSDLVSKALKGSSDTIFSDLSDLKTTIGDLVYKHGSALDSKAALNDVYHAVSGTLDDAAQKVGGSVGANYAQANDLYHKTVAVVNGLEGRAIDAKKLFDTPTIVSALTAAAATHGPAALLTVPAAAIGMKAAENYAPQAIASGLNASAPFMSQALQAGIRAVPVVGNAIYSGLTDNE